MKKPESKLTFPNGISMKNRFMLAPLTNTQSYENGELSEDERKWLTMRAQGGFGMVMTCASHVQKEGQGFPGQLGIFHDKLIDGHKKLVKSIHNYGSLAIIQLHHAGMRSPNELIGQKSICSSDNLEYDARAMSICEITQLKNDFFSAAIRAQKSGYDGVEIHAAHGYIIAQFLSSTINHRTDEYGGSLDNRVKLLFEIIKGIKKHCGNNFLIGVRLSPEKFGMDINETRCILNQLIDQGNVDFIDISLWDCFKYPSNKKYNNKTLLEHFTDINYKNVKFTVAGNINSANDVDRVLNAGVDFVGIGKSAILHHNFAQLVIENPNFVSTKTPVTVEYLKNEGLGDKFIQYLGKWQNFIKK